MNTSPKTMAEIRDAEAKNYSGVELGKFEEKK